MSVEQSVIEAALRMKGAPQANLLVGLHERVPPKISGEDVVGDSTGSGGVPEATFVAATRLLGCLTRNPTAAIAPTYFFSERINVTTAVISSALSLPL